MCKYHKCLTSVFMSTENVFCRPLNSENVVLGTLRSQSVCLPAYNMYMGGVDNTGRVRKPMGTIESVGGIGSDFLSIP